jgi:ABC-type dipeptide/oligopeptide/nickel transport system permease subunit
MRLKGLNTYMIIGLAIIMFFILMASFADYIAPYSPVEKVGPERSPRPVSI